MNKYLHLLELYFKRRQVLHEAIYANKPEAIAEFFKANLTEAEDDFFYNVANTNIKYAPWHSLLISIGFIITNSSKAESILTELVKDDFPGWKSLNQEQVDLLFCYAQENNLQELFLNLKKRIKHKNFKLVIPDIQTDYFCEWSKIYLTCNIPVKNLMEVTIEYLELESNLSINEDMISDKIGIKNAYNFCKILWDNNYKEESLKILHILSIGYPKIIENDMLNEIAENLLNLISISTGNFQVFDMHDTNNNQPSLYGAYASPKKFLIKKITYGIVRSANILRFFPDCKWVVYLKKSWLYLKDIIDEEYDYKVSNMQLPISLASAINALSIALGVCSAMDSSCKSLYTGKDDIDKLEEKLQTIINRRKTLVNDYNNLINKNKLDIDYSNNIEESIETKRKSIKSLDKEIKRIDTKIKDILSPAAHLVKVLKNDQNNFILRQGVAWGLHSLSKSTYLEKSSKEEINETIQNAINNEGQLNKDFKERYIYFSPTNDLLEFEMNIREGISWILDLIIKEDYAEILEKKFNNIRNIAKLLIKYIPGIFDFLHEYPL
jgi:hypothetical protein